MSKYEILDNLVREGNGYLTTAQAVTQGISKPALAAYVKSRKMRRVEHGIYLAEDAWEDALYQLWLLNRKVVFSHESALFLHGLMEREPKSIFVTVPTGYNATHLRKRGIHVSQVRPAFYSLGSCQVKTSFGHVVYAYDIDRTLCDIVKNKAAMDIQVFQYAMKAYMESKKKNLNHLMVYAKVLDLEKTIRTYTEVLL